MRRIKISGWGNYHPESYIDFSSGRRYRAEGRETQLDIGIIAAERALERAGLSASDIDCLVCASAVIMQPIPCSAALYHEQLMLNSTAPALDICSTCTSFITALDMLSYLIDAGRYMRVMVISADIAIALNPDDQDVYQLFSDGAAAFIIESCPDGESGVIGAAQQTWSDGTHATEIKAGGTLYPPFFYNECIKTDYMFKMDGLAAVRTISKHLPDMYKNFLDEHSLTINDIDLVIPHQASPVLPSIMRGLKIPKGKYVNNFIKYGNMISASIPYTLCECLKDGRINREDIVLLLGTAAGLTTNLLLLKF